MHLLGLLITKDDHDAFGDWCRDQLPLYDAVVCLDGSETDETARRAREFSDRLIYLRPGNPRLSRPGLEFHLP